jgi:hypothetical protein
MASHSLTEYEAYCLDVAGYIVLPSVLTERELAAVRPEAGGDDQAAAIAALGAHPTLARYTNILMTPAKVVREDEATNELSAVFKPDGAPHLLADTGRRLCGGSWLDGGHRDPRKNYTAHAGCMLSSAVRGFFVIDLPARPEIVPRDGSAPRHHDGSYWRSPEGLGLAQGSHNSWVPPPTGWLGAGARVGRRARGDGAVRRRNQLARIERRHTRPPADPRATAGADSRQ